MKFVASHNAPRQIVVGLSLAGVLIGLSAPVIKLVWLEYANGGSSGSQEAAAGVFDLLAALLVPLSLAVLSLALFVRRQK